MLERHGQGNKMDIDHGVVSTHATPFKDSFYSPQTTY